jgi:hypothetical protein
MNGLGGPLRNSEEVYERPAIEKQYKVSELQWAVRERMAFLNGS